MQIKKEDVDRVYAESDDMIRKNPLSITRKDVLHGIVLKSVIRVINTSGILPSNCQLIIKGINPLQQVDLCRNCTLVGFVESPSTTAGPVAVGHGESSVC